MKMFEDTLEKLDRYFASKKENEKWLLILSVALVISYLGYAQFLPYTQDLYDKSEKIIQKIDQSMASSNEYLNSITVNGDRDYYLHQKDNEYKGKKNTILSLENKIVYIDKSLEKLSDMLFNQKSWSRFLNSITKKAEVHQVNLKYITNRYMDNNGSFGHVLEIGLGAVGNYQNIVKFMNELEQNVLVTDIFKTELKLDENSSNIVADIHISVWGINH